MKKNITSCAALILCTLTASQFAHARAIEPQEQMVLALIDSHCDDSWCERGNVNNYYFYAINCENAQNCKLQYTVDLIPPEKNNAGINHMFVQATCPLQHVFSLREAWTTAGRVPTLTEPMLADLNDCLN